MNKSELLASMAEKGKITKVDAERALNAFIQTVEETLVKGEKVQLVGFGTFEARERKARSGKKKSKFQHQKLQYSKLENH